MSESLKIIFLKENQSKLESLKKKKLDKPRQQQEEQMSEEEKVKQRSKPVSSTPVTGTPWCVVWTRDGRVFFYNPSEHVSLWERPSILKGRSDVDKLLNEPPKEVEIVKTTSSSSTTAKSSFNLSNSSIMQPGTIKKKLSTDNFQNINENSNDEPPFKKNK